MSKGFHVEQVSAYVPVGTKRILERLDKQHGCRVSCIIREGLILAMQRLRQPVPDGLKNIRPDLPMEYA